MAYPEDTPNFIEGEYEVLDEQGRPIYRSKPEPPVHVNPAPPYVTYALITINVLVWLVEVMMGGSDNLSVLVRMGAKQNHLIAAGEYWRLFTPIFLHGGLDHLVFNSFALYLWGRFAEALFGKVKYIMVYIIAGLVGSLASYLFSPSVSVGASGAIFGILGTLLYFRKRSRELFNRIFGVQVIIIIALNLFNGFTRPGIDNWGHIGGLLGGYLAAHATGLLGERKLQWRKLAAAALLISLFVIALPYGQTKYLSQADKELSKYFFNREDYQKAEEHALKAKARHQQDKEIDAILSDIYFNKGARAYNESQYDQAEKMAEASLRYGAQNGRAHLLMGHVQYQKGDLTQAKAHLIRALELDPSLDEARKLLEVLDKTI